MRFKRGVKHSAFYPITSKEARQFWVYNHYLRPRAFRDPEAEYETLRTAVGLYDITGEEVIEVVGPDAAAVVNAAVLRDAHRLAPGRCLYTAMCSDYGGIVDDGILARFDEERFWFIGGEGQAEQQLYWLALGKRATVRSLLDTIHLLGVYGPAATSMLQSIADVDLTAIPFYSLIPRARVAGIPVTITKTSWTGDDGYDLYVAAEHGVVLYERIRDAGRSFGLQPCGSDSLNIRRIEVGVLMYGTDLDWTTTPFEAGLDWMIDEAKGPFCGRTALLDAARHEPVRCVVGLEVDGQEPAIEHTVICADDASVGEVTSATISPRLGKSIALAMVARSVSAPGTILSVRTPSGSRAARVVSLPFDPTKRSRRARPKPPPRVDALDSPAQKQDML